MSDCTNGAPCKGRLGHCPCSGRLGRSELLGRSGRLENSKWPQPVQSLNCVGAEVASKVAPRRFEE
eukprot:15483449-Alexandrium_andersonii.AAC.1